ncbi:hypothetical protein AN477_19745 [Alicyclobacillus ferrooxydans]|uniref:IstB-like ATP-binding domain-containing protein n=2 Tax=Alicyclobacillus ferrooxydans TaxID=471514 RepID=A0A0N8PNN3_9BACL|nr:hypothetical protein AN477_19745 [Alicyclobacillus ferrooxydans]
MKLFDWSVHPPALKRHHVESCRCVPRKRVDKALKHSHISEEFRKRTFETFETQGKDKRIQMAYRLAKRYAETFEERRGESKNWFGIVGAVGIGKTHLLCAIANALLSRGIFVRYFNFVTGFKEMFAKYDQGGQAVEEIRWELMTCEVLMIDDLAKGKFDRRAKSVGINKSVFDEIYALIDFRYENNLPVIWSSEMYAELASDGVIGEATASRLFERSYIADMTYKDGEPKGSLNHRLLGFEG